MIDWSVTNLPLPSALSVTNRSAALRKKAESGRYLQRRRFTTSYEEGTISFKFLKEQFQIFKGVWVHYLENGTTSFTIDLPVGGNTTLTNCEVKFISDYSYQYVSVDYVTVQAKIEFKEVTSPDKLALDNLINVGDIYLQRKAETVEVTFTNIDGSSTNYVRCTINGDVTNAIPQATQFWDGTVHLHTGTPSTFKYLEQTISEEEFVLHHYPTLNTTNPEPNPDGKFGQFTIANGQINLKRWDPNSTTSYYWKSIVLTNALNYLPPSPNDSFRYHITSNFEKLHMTNCDLIKKVILTCEDNASFGTDDTLDDLYLYQCDLLDEVTINIAPNNITAPYSRLKIDGNNALTTLDLSGVQPISYPTYCYTTIKNNASLQTFTIEGSSSPVAKVTDFSNNNLSSINISNGYWWVSGGAGNTILRNNNFTASDLLSFISQCKGAPDTYAHLNQLGVSGNPCWQNNEMYPVGFAGTTSITSISATTTDFTVTTASSHNLSPNDDILIVATSSGLYLRPWTVATTPTSTTFTVDTTGLYGGSTFPAATGGSFKTGLGNTSTQVQVLAAYSNFIITS